MDPQVGRSVVFYSGGELLFSLELAVEFFAGIIVFGSASMHNSVKCVLFTSFLVLSLLECFFFVHIAL